MNRYIRGFCALFLCILFLLAGCGMSTPPAPAKPAPPKWIPPHPVTTGFTANDPKKYAGGLSELTVDNSRNDFDVLAKLYYIGSGQEVARIFNIRAGESFVVKPVKAGTYDLRFRNLKTGDIFKTDPMTFEETKTSTGTKYSTIRFTLYTVKGGNARTTGIDESQF